MANDRMFLKNKISGKILCLAKHYETNWYTPSKYEEKTCSLQLKLDEFFNEHEVEFYKDPHAWEIIFED